MTIPSQYQDNTSNDNADDPIESHPRDLKTWSLDELITLEQAAKDLPGNRNVSTIYRWAESGSRGVYLTCVSVGHKRYTTHDWLKNFLLDCEAARQKEKQADLPFEPQVPYPSERRERTRPDHDEDAQTRETLHRHGLDPYLESED